MSACSRRWGEGGGVRALEGTLSVNMEGRKPDRGGNVDMSGDSYGRVRWRWVEAILSHSRITSPKCSNSSNFFLISKHVLIHVVFNTFACI